MEERQSNRAFNAMEQTGEMSDVEEEGEGEDELKIKRKTIKGLIESS